MKRFLKESKSIKETLYYFKGFLNGDLGFIELQSPKKPFLKTGLIIDLNLEQSFTTASSFKLVYLKGFGDVAKPTNLVEEMYLTKVEQKLFFKNMKLKYVEEDYKPAEIQPGDLIITKEGDFGFSLAKLYKNEENILMGRIINAKGLDLLDEIQKNELQKEFAIKEFSTLRRRIMITTGTYYVMFSLFLLVLVTLIPFDKKEKPSVYDKRILDLLEENKKDISH